MTAAMRLAVCVGRICIGGIVQCAGEVEAFDADGVSLGGWELAAEAVAAAYAPRRAT